MKKSASKRAWTCSLQPHLPLQARGHREAGRASDISFRVGMREWATSECGGRREMRVAPFDSYGKFLLLYNQ